MKNTMLRFNILPPEFTEEFLFSKKIDRIGRSLRIGLGILSIFSLFLIFILGYLQYQQDTLAQTLATTRKNPAAVEYENIQKNIAAMNKELTAINNQPRTVDWSLLLLEIAGLTPQTITLQKISVAQSSEQTPRITLEGIATQREHLIAFEQGLRQSSLLSTVESPLSNYEKISDIKFSLTVQQQSAFTPPSQ